MAVNPAPSPTHEAPYRGLRVLDFGQGIASPYAWLSRLHAADIIAERIFNPGEWLRNVHVEATKAAVCQDTPGVGPVEDSLCPAPDIGQDSVEVLIEAGLDRNAIDGLIKAGAVRQAKL